MIYCLKLIMKKGYIFDFDGVICDTENFHYLAWKKVAEEINTSFSEEEYKPFRSTGRKTVISFLLSKAGIAYSDELYDRLCAVKSSCYARLTDSVGANNLIKGADVFIKKLYSEGYSLAVASSGSFATVLLKKLNLFDYFGSVIDGTYPIPKKPDPTVFLTASESLGLPVSDCVVFEDSQSGIEAAKRGGFTVVGVGGIKGDYSIKDFTELSL